MKYIENNNINNLVELIKSGIKTGNRLIDELDPDWYMLLDEEWIDDKYKLDLRKTYILKVIR